jgi:hypothetical protein
MDSPNVIPNPGLNALSNGAIYTFLNYAQGMPYFSTLRLKSWNFHVSLKF